MATLYSVVIPVYNSTQSLELLSKGILNVFKEQIREPVEIIFVDDASPNPNTWLVLQQLTSQHPEIKALQLTRNFGKLGALFCALHECRGDYVITMDDDLQQNPDDIPLLLAKKEHDAVIGSFSKYEQPGYFKRLSSRLFDYFLQIVFGKPRHLQNTPFKLLKGAIVREMLQINTPHPSVLGHLFFVTRDVVNAEIKHHPRQFGSTGFTFWKMLQIVINILVNNSSVLLRSVAIIGVCMAISSFLLALYFIVSKFAGHVKVSGFTTMVVLLLFTSGLVLFSVGIIGEYLIRIINGIEKRPAFIVRQKTDRPTP